MTEQRYTVYRSCDLLPKIRYNCQLVISVVDNKQTFSTQWLPLRREPMRLRSSASSVMRSDKFASVVDVALHRDSSTSTNPPADLILRQARRFTHHYNSYLLVVCCQYFRRCIACNVSFSSMDSASNL